MEKGQPQTSDFEVDSHDLHLQSKTKTLRMVDNARIATTALALLMGITVLGVSGNTLAVWNDTYVSPSDFYLPLWPEEFNIRPTVALVAGSAFVIVANIVGLCFSKVQVVSACSHESQSVERGVQEVLTLPTLAPK
jgi:hypothetical protein